MRSEGSYTFVADAPGTFYYVCSVPGHCGLGQKIAITVMTGFPPPSPPPPGLDLAWTIPMAPQTLSLSLGDTLVLTWSHLHDVYESASRADFDACVTTGGVRLATSAVNRYQHTFTAPGTYHWICTVPGHCAGGQKLAITVADPSASPVARVASPPPTDASTQTPPPEPSQTAPNLGTSAGLAQTGGGGGAGMGAGAGIGIGVGAAVVVLAAGGGYWWRMRAKRAAAGKKAAYGGFDDLGAVGGSAGAAAEASADTKKKTRKRRSLTSCVAVSFDRKAGAPPPPGPPPGPPPPEEESHS